MSLPQDSHAAFAAYVLPEIEVLYRVARSLTYHDADAEDLVQDTLLRAFRSIEHFDGRYPRAWLLTIMRNAHINRNRRRRPSLLADPDLIDDATVALARPPQDPAEILAESGFDAVVDAAHHGLPDNFRVVIDLVDVNGLSYAEAAAVLEVPEGTVMSRLHRGRKRIRTALTEAGMTRGARP